MRKLMIMCVAAMMAATTLAQSRQAELQAELDAIYKAMQEAKPSKEAKAEAKRLEKEGWKAPDGEKSILQQVNESILYGMEQMADEEGNTSDRFLMQTGTHTGSSYAICFTAARAKAQAMLAGMMESKVASLMEMKVKNEEASGVKSSSEMRQHIKEIVNNTLKNTIPVLQLYRQLPNNLYEVQVRMAIDAKSLAASFE